MRFGLKARFVAILLLAGLIALAALIGLDRHSRAHDQAISGAAQDLMNVAAARQGLDEQHQGVMTARIEAADHDFRVDLLLTFFLLAALFAFVSWLAWLWIVKPVLGLAEIARRIEAGDEITPLVDSQRDDEVGDLACAFNTLNDALIAARRRIDHETSKPEPTTSGGTMILPAVAEVPRAAAVSPPPPPRPPPPPPPPQPTPAQLERMKRLEDDLREAWQRDEISVVYQPIHAISDGSMRGAEALLRWHHRVEGPISPGEFIPIAERSDVIVELGRHVLVQACADASLWPGDGTAENSPFVSVNVAPRQLRDTQLFEYVVEALRKSGLAASRLHLEMPVSVLRDGESAIEAMLEQLRGLGVQIWLDATGEDAGDQDRWMKAPVSGVKVGHSRIADKASTASGEASIVATARALRIVAVIVGVEELSELNVLKEQGADLAQGYVLCKPVSTAEIGRRLLA
jgi:EAL domain-containing protein (putative c-di-GMP-specific phosphodiesterase class I)/HAMP domain-containing protein